MHAGWVPAQRDANLALAVLRTSYLCAFSEPSCVSVVFFGTANSVSGSLQLDYCGAASHCLQLYTLWTYLVPRSCTNILRCVDVLFGGGVSNVVSVF